RGNGVGGAGGGGRLGKTNGARYPVAHHLGEPRPRHQHHAEEAGARRVVPACLPLIAPGAARAHGTDLELAVAVPLRHVPPLARDSLTAGARARDARPVGRRAWRGGPCARRAGGGYRARAKGWRVLWLVGIWPRPGGKGVPAHRQTGGLRATRTGGGPAPVLRG